MIKILHISDLHFYKDAQTYNMQEILIKEAKQAVQGLPRGQKLLVVTGDFHTFKEDNYNMAETFLKRLIEAMDIDPAQDVFVIPGNHDVGNENVQKAIGIDPDDTAAYTNMLKNGKLKYVEKKLKAYIPYCTFVRRMGFYPESDDELYPARVHVRQWKGKKKLNILHLNTTLSADGSADKTNQAVDVISASDPETWKTLWQDDIPAIAMGHNHFCDLKEDYQRLLEGTFSLKNISAYLCGDTHRLEKDARNQMISLSSGAKQGRLEIPNLVCAKSIGDMEDDYSDFGYYWHEWDEETGEVNVYFRRWKQEYKSETKHDESADGFYCMRPFSSASGQANTTIVDSGTGIDELKKYLDNCLLDVRKNHPSFRLMDRDEIDKRLLPDIKERNLSEALAKESDNEPASPVWKLIQSYWNASDKRNIIIQGDGGIGKTVTLLSITSSSNAISHPPAVYIPLHNLVAKDGKCQDIPAFLKQKYPEFYNEIGRLAAGGWDNGPRLLLLLDGFNEVPVLLRSEILHSINDWDNAHPGAQLIAVSRPTTGISLQELSGNPVKVTLEPLTRETVRSYLKDCGAVVPKDSSAIWKELKYPLFLTLYVKTGKLKDLKSDGYSLAPKQVESGGALIWNFLQRELLRIDSEKWVIRCALACEYIIPYIAYRMAKDQRFTITAQETKEYISETIESLDIATLPRHLRQLYQAYYEKYFEYPNLDKTNWNQTVLQDIGIMVSGKGAGAFAFMHQNFRDCLAGLHLLNQAEMTENIEDYPALWQESHHPDLIQYASELMDRETFANLWEKNRILQPTHHTGTINLLETRKYRDDWGDLVFSGMDLYDLSLARFMGGDQYDLSLFREPGLTIGTRMNTATFHPEGHVAQVICVAVTSDGLCVSGSWDSTLRVWDPFTGECLHILEGYNHETRDVAVTPDGLCVSGSWEHTLRVWDLHTGKCLSILQGHKGDISCVTVTSDGLCVSGSEDNTLRVWDLHTGKCLSVLEGHKDGVNCVAVESDGLCISGSKDNTLRVWDLHTGECLHVLEGHNKEVNCVAVTLDGLCVSGSDDYTIRIWNPHSGECLHTLEEHTSGILCIAVTPDGLFVSGSEDNTLRVWDSHTGRCLHVLKGHNGGIEGAAVTPDGLCISGSWDTSLRIWNLHTGECLHVLNEHKEGVSCVAITRYGLCISGSWDSSLRVWNLRTGECLHNLDRNRKEINCMAVTLDGLCVSGSWDCSSWVWNLHTGECLHALEAKDENIFCMLATPDGLCVSESLLGYLSVWDLHTGKRLRILNKNNPRTIRRTLVTMDGLCVSGIIDGSIRVWDVHTGKCLCVYKKHKARITCMAVTRQGLCVSGSGDHTLQIWDLHTGESLNVLKGQKEIITDVAIALDGLYICGVMKNILIVWDSRTGELLHVLKGHIGDISCMSITEGGMCVSGSDDSTLRVWDLRTGKCLHVLNGHIGGINCVSVTEDGMCVSGSDDTILRVWDLHTGQCLRVLKGHDYAIKFVEVTPDGLCISGSNYNPLLVWNLHTGECINILDKLSLNLQGMNLSKARLDEELKMILPANGVII